MTTDNPITAPIHTLWQSPHGVGMKQGVYRKGDDCYVILSFTKQREHTFGKIAGIWQLAYCKPDDLTHVRA